MKLNAMEEDEEDEMEQLMNEIDGLVEEEKSNCMSEDSDDQCVNPQDAENMTEIGNDTTTQEKRSSLPFGYQNIVMGMANIKQYQESHFARTDRYEIKERIELIHVPETYKEESKKSRNFKYLKQTIDLTEQIPDSKYPVFVGMTKEQFDLLYNILTCDVKFHPNIIPYKSKWEIFKRKPDFDHIHGNRTFDFRSELFVVLTVLTTGMTLAQVYDYIGMGKILGDENKTQNKKTDIIGKMIDYCYKDFISQMRSVLFYTIRESKEFNLPFAIGNNADIVEMFPEILHTYSAVDSRTHKTFCKYSEVEDENGRKRYIKDKRYYGKKINGSGRKVEIEVNYYGMIINYSFVANGSMHDNKLHSLYPREGSQQPHFILGDLGYITKEDKRIVTPIKKNAVDKTEEKQWKRKC